METIAAGMPGFIGIESAREGIGITVCYWQSLEAIAAWKVQAEHELAQILGKEQWYSAFHTRVAKVERDYRWDRNQGVTPSGV